MSLSFLSLFPFSSRVCALAPTPETRPKPSGTWLRAPRWPSRVAPRAARPAAPPRFIFSSHLISSQSWQALPRWGPMQRSATSTTCSTPSSVGLTVCIVSVVSMHHGVWQEELFLLFQFSSMRRPNLLQTWPPHAKMAKGEGGSSYQFKNNKE